MTQHDYLTDEKKYLTKVNQLFAENRPSFLPEEIEFPLGEKLITEYVSERAIRMPNHPVINFYGREVSFKELDDLSNRFASYLHAQGLTKGDAVAVYLPNCPQFLFAFYGILKLGCIHVPVNPMFKEEELLYELVDTDAKIILTADVLLPLVNQIKEKTKLKQVITTSLGDYLPEEPSLPVHEMYLTPKTATNNTIDFATMIEKQDDKYPDNNVHLDDIASLNYTGGTTGLPKGCIHTQRNMLYASAGSNTFSTRLEESDVAIAYLPSFWIAGQVLCLLNPVITGATHILFGRWDQDAALQAVEKYKITHFVGLVDEYVGLIERPDIKNYDLSSIKISIGSSFVKKINSNYRKQWYDLTETYLRETSWGMTETHTVNTYTTGLQKDDLDLEDPVFVGLPVPGTEFKIIDFDNGSLKPLGEPGEICVRTPTLLKAYWNKPEATEEAIIDGWLHTGDVGKISEKGFLHYLGRNKEMLKVNGMSVFPQELEVLLSRHPAISATGVVGKKDDVKGEIPVAFIMLEEEYIGKYSEADLEEWCKENMAVYKVPVIKIVESLPMTATGKVVKVELQENIESYF